MTKLQRLYEDHRQSPWLDNLTRLHLREGTLERLVAGGIRGGRRCIELKGDDGARPCGGSSSWRAVKKGSNNSIVSMNCRDWAAKWRHSDGAIVQCNRARSPDRSWLDQTLRIATEP
jgi:hypothetical protein